MFEPGNQTEPKENNENQTETIEDDNEDLFDDISFSLPRGHVPQSYLDLSNTEIASMDEHLPESNIGYKLLLKMGWKVGQGLGSLQQGRKEPIRIDIKTDSLGVGKLEEENYYHSTSTARRKALDSEKIAEETEEERVQRQNKVQKQESIKKELETINAAFYCALCDKQYTKISEYETHLSSYDHNHRKRFKEMKESNRPTAKLDRKREKERKREEKELARMQQAALLRAGSKQSTTNDILNNSSASKSSSKSPTNNSTSKANLSGSLVASSTSDKNSEGGGGGWTSVDISSSSSPSISTNSDNTQPGGWNFVRATTTSNTSGWNSPSAFKYSGWSSTVISSTINQPNNINTGSDTPDTVNLSNNTEIKSKSKLTFGIGKTSGDTSEIQKPAFKFGFKKK
ncbi:3632_t:CDS:2 [Funneliformis geosporum]|uniref:3632_t:CDS:1 n=1 Tax=Funneliformis geosporum TaxID=1117311 RepID=A0A9W4WSI5_9GLOM|nr:3632_t:CDS:2 [Funneliformis geosporum]